MYPEIVLNADGKIIVFKIEFEKNHKRIPSRFYVLDNIIYTYFYHTQHNGIF